MTTGKICLASASPRRQELLQQIGINFVVEKSDIDETIVSGEIPRQYVTRMATAKAKTVYDNRKNKNKTVLPVLGADTAVIIGNAILGKPKNKADGHHMLSRLSGRSHEVMTAIALVTEKNKIFQAISTSRVTFKSLDEEEISLYLDTGEANDKAGGYGIQGMAATFISKLEGSYSAVVGLPLSELSELLKLSMAINSEK